MCCTPDFPANEFSVASILDKSPVVGATCVRHPFQIFQCLFCVIGKIRVFLIDPITFSEHEGDFEFVLLCKSREQESLSASEPEHKVWITIPVSL